MNKLTIGDVVCFDDPKPDKEQAVKVLEEAAEVFGAWQEWDAGKIDGGWVVDELCDVVQASANLLFAMGVTDLRPDMLECEERNRSRGRIS